MHRALVGQRSAPEGNELGFEEWQPGAVQTHRPVGQGRHSARGLQKSVKPVSRLIPKVSPR